MKEEQLLDNTLGILEKDGAAKAYEYILLNKKLLDDYGSQLYNFLYCLSASIGLKDDSLAWIKEAVIDKGYWYRPSVFEDSDLDSIRNEAVFAEYKKISDARYYEASKAASTLCTWKKAKAAKLALVLHGNQQNMFAGREYWQFLKNEGYQIEYVQSRDVDSYMLYRWEESSKPQLDKIIGQIPWDEYKSRALCGFSAGCNEILKTLLSTPVLCEEIILLSPWIPIIDENLEKLAAVIEKVRIRIICGENDHDCLPYAKRLAKEMAKKGADCTLQVIGGLGHSYPSESYCPSTHSNAHKTNSL